jgi:UDP-3-O-[3-hydroxymyristoyl] glucosamine N-acyltransferase
MRKIILFILFIAFNSGIVFSQSVPQGMRYQAVARDEAGKTIDGENISIQISLRAGEKGDVLYTERHQVTTNQLGLFSITIGEGKAILGEFASIPWSLANIWLDIDMNEAGGKIFTNINSSQLLTVPYAFHAGTAGNYSGMDDPTQKNGLQFYWSTTGNLMTLPGTHYVGTRDYTDFVFKTNNLQRMTITKDGNIDIDGSLDVGINLTVGNNVFIGNDLRVERDGSFGRDLLVERNGQFEGNLEVDGTLGVDGITTLRNIAESTTKDNGSLIVEGGVGIEKNVNIGGNTEIDGTLGVDGITTVKNTTESTNKDNGALIIEGGVGIEKNTNIGGNLGVTMNSVVGANSTVGANLTVGGNSSIGGSETIGGSSTIGMNLLVGGNATVTGNTTTATLNVNTSANIRTKLVVDGNSAINGADGTNAPYPLVVQGSNQGVWININGSRSNANNFVTFADGSGIQGRIEGQTLAELQSSSEYERETTIFALTIAGFTANIIALGAEAAAAAATVIGIPEGVAIAAQATAQGIELAGIIVERDGYISDVEGNVGVAYESGSGDYAEWLQRSEMEKDMSFGQVVGVKGGIISLNTDNADHFMVVSKSPIVLGNMPNPAEEAKYEKIAFMGQVPVRVVGAVNIGDYIIPSGNNDGYAIGVSPSAMKIDDYARIVGVAWQSASDKPGNYVNIAVGINNNDLARKMLEQQQQIAHLSTQVSDILTFLEGKGSLPNNNISTNISEEKITRSAVQNQTRLGKTMSDEDFDSTIDAHATRLNAFYAELSKTMQNEGVDINKMPELAAFFGDPIAGIKKARRESKYESLWGNFDNR